MPANGSLLSTSQFTKLFIAIGYSFGGSGSRFALPDTRGRALMGAGHGLGLTNRILGQSIGAESAPAPSVTQQPTFTMPAHFHGTGTINIRSSGLHTHLDGGHIHPVSDSGHVHNFMTGQTEAVLKYVSTGPFSIASDPSNPMSARTLQTTSNIGVGTGRASLASVSHVHTSSDFTGSVGAATGKNGDVDLIASLALPVKISSSAIPTVVPSLVCKFLIKY
jgi:microcystin-dependent protein